MMQIGYVPYSNDLSHPADRRRLKMWADYEGVNLNVGNPLRSDVLVLSGTSNFHYWRKKFKGPIVLDLIDGYLNYTPNMLEDVGRNIIRTLKNGSSLEFIRFTKYLESAVGHADFIVTSCPEQRESIAAINPSTHDILDDHSELNSTEFPKELRKGDSHEFTLLWEGYGSTLKHLISKAEQIDEFLFERKARLILVTQANYPKYGNFLVKVKTQRLIEKNFPLSFNRIVIHDWTIRNLISSAYQSNSSIIPINEDDNLAWAKPENKVLSFWTMNIPSLFSPIPSYARVAKLAGAENYLVKHSEWFDKLNEMYNNYDLIKHSVKEQRDYINKHHSRASLAAKWNQVFESIM